LVNSVVHVIADVNTDSYLEAVIKPCSVLNGNLKARTFQFEAAREPEPVSAEERKKPDKSPESEEVLVEVTIFVMKTSAAQQSLPQQRPASANKVDL
jgi:hypothetical protein